MLNWNQVSSDDPGATCDPFLVCGTALTCVDGLEYPTTCGPTNCDLPIGPCVTENPDTGVAAGSDSFGSRSGIDGAAGQREGSNVDAGIESGEPNRAGNSGGASLWWSWSAPTTGEVTFDTRGSSFDTLLAVYTGTSLSRLTAIASNDDDPAGGSLQSAVRFSARQGQTYHIAVDDYRGASGDIVLNWRTVVVRSGPTRPLRERVSANPGPGQPSYMVAGDSAGLQYWMDPDGTVRQSLYESADGTQRVRIFYDEAVDLPRAVRNEVSGHWLSIRKHGPERVDFMQYDRTGNYLHGFSVFSEGRGEDRRSPRTRW